MTNISSRDSGRVPTSPSVNLEREQKQDGVAEVRKETAKKVEEQKSTRAEHNDAFAHHQEVGKLATSKADIEKALAAFSANFAPDVVSLVEQNLGAKVDPLKAMLLKAQISNDPKVKQVVDNVKAALAESGRKFLSTWEPPPALKESLRANPTLGAETQKQVLAKADLANVDLGKTPGHTDPARRDSTNASSGSAATGRPMLVAAKSEAKVDSSKANSSKPDSGKPPEAAKPGPASTQGKEDQRLQGQKPEPGVNETAKPKEGLPGGEVAHETPAANVAGKAAAPGAMPFGAASAMQRTSGTDDGAGGLGSSATQDSAGPPPPNVGGDPTGARLPPPSPTQPTSAVPQDPAASDPWANAPRPYQPTTSPPVWSAPTDRLSPAATKASMSLNELINENSGPDMALIVLMEAVNDVDNDMKATSKQLMMQHKVNDAMREYYSKFIHDSAHLKKDDKLEWERMKFEIGYDKGGNMVVQSHPDVTEVPGKYQEIAGSSSSLSPEDSLRQAVGDKGMDEIHGNGSLRHTDDKTVVGQTAYRQIREETVSAERDYMRSALQSMQQDTDKISTNMQRLMDLRKAELEQFGKIYQARGDTWDQNIALMAR